MGQREKLIELLQSFQNEYPKSFDSLYHELAAEADHLLASGVVVLPCRCGECEYRLNHDKLCCGFDNLPKHENDYCSYGETQRR